MKYTIELTLAGLAKDVTEGRDDLTYLYGEQEIDFMCKQLGWDQLDEDRPSSMWVEVVDGDYGDIFCTFASSFTSRYNSVYKVIRKMESVLGPDYDLPVPVQGTMKNICNQIDEARMQLHAVCQISNSFMIAKLFQELTVVGDKIYKVAYPTKERDDGD